MLPEAVGPLPGCKVQGYRLVNWFEELKRLVPTDN